MRALSFFVSFFFVCACGGSDSDGVPAGAGSSSGTSSPPPSSPAPGPGDPPCVSTTDELCSRASGCSGTAGKLIIAYGTTVTEEHESLADCRNFYRHLVCSDAKNAASYGEDCRTALVGASCIATNKGMALAFPATCSKK
jgi:hypothetical protein